MVSKDLNTIYYTGKQAKSIKSLTTHIYVYHVNSKVTEILYHEDDYAINDMFILEDKVIVAATNMQKFGINENNHFYELKDKKLELFKSYGLSTSGSVGSDVRLGRNTSSLVYQDKIYFIRTKDDHNQLMSLNKNKELEIVYDMNGTIDGIQVMDQELYFVGQNKQKLQEIYKIEDNKIKQVSRLNATILKDKYVAKPKTFVYKQKNHVVKGFVLYPKDFEQTKSYPAILDIHGGPKTVYGKVFIMRCKLGQI